MVVGTFFYKSEIPEVQINLHFGLFELIIIAPPTSIYRDLTVHKISIVRARIIRVNDYSSTSADSILRFLLLFELVSMLLGLFVQAESPVVRISFELRVILT